MAKMVEYWESGDDPDKTGRFVTHGEWRKILKKEALASAEDCFHQLGRLTSEITLEDVADYVSYVWEDLDEADSRFVSKIIWSQRESH